MQLCESQGSAPAQALQPPLRQGWQGGAQKHRELSLSLVCTSTFFSPLVKVFLKIRVEPLVIFKCMCYSTNSSVPVHAGALGLPA